MKVVLAGGGTGGHVYPALAMGDALKAHGHEVIYVGAPDRLEAPPPTRHSSAAARPTAAWPRVGCQLATC